MKDVVIFHLAKYFPPRTMKPYHMADPRTLYEKIKDGSKTSEWRDLSKYWVKRLCVEGKSLDGKTLVRTADFFIGGDKPQDLKEFLKVHRAWFVESYPKDSLPRLEAEITGLVYHPSDSQLEIKFTNVKEVKKETTT